MLHNRSKEQSFCPIVSFFKIILKEGGSSSAYNGSAPQQGKTSSLVVTIDAFVQDMDYGNSLSEFLSDELFGKYLKIKIIQSTHSRGTKFLKKPPSSSGQNHGSVSSYLVQGKNVLSVQEYAIIDILQGKTESRYKTMDSDGNMTTIIPFNFQFEIENTSNPEHLSYFIFSYYDFSNLGSGFNLPAIFEQVAGQIEYRTVIDKFLIQK